MEAPEEFKALIGTVQKLGGYLFNYEDNLEFEDYHVKDWRFGRSQVFDIGTGKPIHPTVNLLVVNDNMSSEKWTMGFPCKSIILEGWDRHENETDSCSEYKTIKH